MDRRNPFAAQNEVGTWLLGAVLGVAVVAGLLWVLALVGVREDLSGAFEKPGPSDERVGRVSYGGADLDPAQPHGGAVIVHTCVQVGQRVYSDQPCGPGGETREINLGAINTYAPSAVETTPIAATPRRPVQPPVEATGSAERDGRVCRAIEAEIERIDARMRAGYRSQEGEYWRGRWRDAKERHHLAGCTWHGRGSE